MTAVRVGSLFSGSGGLDMAVCEVLGGETVFVSDIDPGACKVLAHRFPKVPNLGDITTIDWSPWRGCIDVLTGGFPCQDVSNAGKQAGLVHGTRSGLWHEFLRAIDELRPHMVVIENVRGLLSARGDTSEEYESADAEVTRLERLLGLLERKYDRAVREGVLSHVGYHARDRHRIMGQHRRAMAARRRAERRIVRALGTVLGSLAGIGYDAQWVGLPASGVGAPHGRFRVFIVAHPEGHPWRLVHGDDRAAADPGRLRSHEGRITTPGQTEGRGPLAGPGERGGVDSLTLLPTPAVNDMGEGKTVEAWDECPAKMKAAHGNGNGHGASLAIEAQRLLPTPRASDGPDASSHARSWSSTDHNLHNVAHEQTWGDYAPAIARWEAITRPAPAPTEAGPKGSPRLSPRFTEWMMGLPDGWITDVPGITRNEALKACGNGVVPQQAEAALRWLLGVVA